MKVLLFTHGSDIDGLGNVVLAKLAYKDIDYVLCKNNFDLTDKLNDYYKNNKLYEYDSIYITDLSPTDELSNTLDNDIKLKNKLINLDHHESKVELNKYNFCNVVIEENNIKTCATSLFYKYLLDNKLLKESNSLNRFVEMTRREDNYEYKKYNDYESHDLAILFNKLGPDNYWKYINNKINNNPNEFRLDDNDYKLINDYKKIMEEHIKEFLKDIYITEENNIKLGVVIINYEYRNEVAEYVINNNIYDIDGLALISFENNQISYRSIRNNNIVRTIAENRGGGGHDTACASYISSELKQKVLKLVFDNK